MILIKVIYFEANIFLHIKFQMIGSLCNCSALFLLSKWGIAMPSTMFCVVYEVQQDKDPSMLRPILKEAELYVIVPQNTGYIRHSSTISHDISQTIYLLHNNMLIFAGSLTSMMVLLLHYNCINIYLYGLSWHLQI